MKTIIGRGVCLFMPEKLPFMLLVEKAGEGLEHGFYVMAASEETERLGGPFGDEESAQLIMEEAARDLATSSIASIPAIIRRLEKAKSAQ